MVQDILALLVVFSALIYAVYGIYGVVSSKKTGNGCAGCQMGGCELKSLKRQ